MNNEDKKALSLLSLAAKAGKVVSGGYMTVNSIADGRACLVIIASDASENTKKKFTNKCHYYNVPCKVFVDSDTLGRQIGKQSRIVVAVTDDGLAGQIAKRICSNEDMEV